MATDVEAVFEGFGTPQQRRIDRITTAELKPMGFAAGSMGPKVGAAIEYVERTGHRAVIGRLDDIEQLVEGSAGTNVVPAAAPVTA
jgi:carbamate kinase